MAKLSPSCGECRARFLMDGDDGRSISIYGKCTVCRGIIPAVIDPVVEVVNVGIVQPVKAIKDFLW